MGIFGPKRRPWARFSLILPIPKHSQVDFPAPGGVGHFGHSTKNDSKSKELSQPPQKSFGAWWGWGAWSQKKKKTS